MRCALIMPRDREARVDVVHGRLSLAGKSRREAAVSSQVPHVFQRASLEWSRNIPVTGPKRGRAECHWPHRNPLKISLFAADWPEPPPVAP